MGETYLQLLHDPTSGLFRIGSVHGMLNSCLVLRLTYIVVCILKSVHHPKFIANRLKSSRTVRGSGNHPVHLK